MNEDQIQRVDPSCLRDRTQGFVISLADDHQLVARPQAAREQAVGTNEATFILANVASPKKQYKI